MDTNLQLLKESIESLDKIHHLEILKRIRISQNSSSNSNLLNENKNGIYVNMNCLSPQVLTEIRNYMDYVAQQEKYLDKVEQEKKDIKKAYFLNKSDT